VKWERLHEYAIRSGQFFVSKSFVAGDAKYQLWTAPYTLHGTFASAAAAKRAAEQMVGVVAAGGDGAGAGCAVGNGVAADAGGG
jgi:hypothetical protein